MRVTLEIDPQDLMLLYIATGNQDAGRVIKEALAAEREFNAVQVAIAKRLLKSSPLPVAH